MRRFAILALLAILAVTLTSADASAWGRWHRRFQRCCCVPPPCCPCVVRPWDVIDVVITPCSGATFTLTDPDTSVDSCWLQSGSRILTCTCEQASYGNWKATFPASIPAGTYRFHVKTNTGFDYQSGSFNCPP